MEKIKNFLNKNGMIIVPLLLVVMFMQTCSKNSKIKRLTKDNVKIEAQMDSLTSLVPTEDNLKLNDYKSQYRVYDRINNEMSKLNRQEQMMTFQNQIILPSKIDLENKIKALENK
jgi:outer membrane murein-binding lipoprotein Lpp